MLTAAAKEEDGPTSTVPATLIQHYGRTAGAGRKAAFP